MDLNINVDGNTVLLGTIDVIDGVVSSNGLPFKEKRVVINSIEFKVHIISYSDCKVIRLAVIEIAYKGEGVYILLKYNKKLIEGGKPEFYVDPNPRKIIDLYVKELDKYNDRKEVMSHGIFKKENKNIEY